jgi:hypothetical protein
VRGAGGRSGRREIFLDRDTHIGYLDNSVVR